ncbi:LCP family protein [Brachybacterium huguangmaarense]
MPEPRVPEPRRPSPAPGADDAPGRSSASRTAHGARSSARPGSSARPVGAVGGRGALGAASDDRADRDDRGDSIGLGPAAAARTAHRRSGRGSRPAPGSTRPPGLLARGPLGRLPRPARVGVLAVALLLVVTLAWGTGLAMWANSRIEHVDALSGAEDTPGTTYLIAGSDRRGGSTVADDGTEGERADTLMILHRAPNGNSYLVSLPRDTLVDIPGHGTYKLNAAYAFGGPKLLVQTVEGFTGLTIDHFVEIGFDGVSGLVDAVGTVNLCLDQDVNDEKSGLVWTAGCHDTGGEQALAFVRARYFDPTADLGRQQRQQQFVAALMRRVMTPGVLLNPVAQVRLAGAGTAALRTDGSTGVVTLGRMALAMRAAMNDGTTLAMPIEDPNFHTKHSGVAIKTDPKAIAAFFGSIEDGSATAPAAA